jgi:hypothetical protein
MHKVLKSLSKKLIVLLLTVCVALIALVVFQSPKRSPLPLSTPTNLPDKRFVVNIPQKALFKNYVTVAVEARPGTSCELTYISPSGDINVMESISSTSGTCVWKWKIDETKGKGIGRLIFTIDGISETHFIEIRSSF